MRRLACIAIILVAILCQTTLFVYIPFYLGVKPDIILVAVICLGVFHTTIEGLLYGLLAGLLIDVPFGLPVGLYLLIYPIAGYVSSFLTAHPKLGLRSPLILYLALSGLKELVFMLYAFLNRVQPDSAAFITYGLSVGTTAICMVCVYPLMRKLLFSRRMGYLGAHDIG